MLSVPEQSKTLLYCVMFLHKAVRLIRGFESKVNCRISYDSYISHYTSIAIVQIALTNYLYKIVDLTTMTTN